MCFSIVGVGNHSKDGVLKIKPAVLELCRELNFPVVQEQNPGRLYISLPFKPRISVSKALPWAYPAPHPGKKQWHKIGLESAWPQDYDPPTYPQGSRSWGVEVLQKRSSSWTFWGIFSFLSCFLYLYSQSLEGGRDVILLEMSSSLIFGGIFSVVLILLFIPSLSRILWRIFWGFVFLYVCSQGLEGGSVDLPQVWSLSLVFWGIYSFVFILFFTPSFSRMLWGILFYFVFLVVFLREVHALKV